ncbi:MAG: phosphate acyltransferase [Eubacteriaceae bacterium]
MITDFKKLENEALKTEKSTLVVAAAGEAEVLSAVAEAKKKNIINVILVGDKNRIKTIINKENIEFGHVEIVDVKDLSKACEKAVAIVNEGWGDFIMKGLVDTSIFLKAVIDKKKGLMKESLLSSVMIAKIKTYHKFLILSDGGMIISPDIEKKKGIIANAVDLARVLGISPIKVACLAAKEKINPKMQATLDAAALKSIGNHGYFGSDVIVDGPMAMDLVVSKKAAEIKSYRSEVAGDADIILAPEIETGNAIIKVMTHLGNAELAGVVMGAKVPIVLTSRSDSENNKLNSILLGAYIASKNK